MLKKLFLLPFMAFLSASSFSQTVPIYKNAYRIAGANNDYGDFIQADNAGNVYVSGRFGTNCDFDPSAGSSTLTSNGATDVFVAKYSASGALIWNFQISGTTETIRGMELDPAGNLYVIGDFTGTLTATASGTGASLTSAGQSDAYLLKYDPSGQLLFSLSYGDIDQDYLQAIAFDAGGNFYLGGEYSSITLDLDPGTSVRTITNYNPAATTFDNYLSKFDSNGNFLWGFGLPSNNSAYTRSITVDNQDRVLLAGYYNDSLLVDSLNNTTLYSVNASIDCFVARYTASGTYENAWSFGGTGTENLLSIDTYNNEIILTGTFSGTVNLATGNDSLMVSSHGSGDVFLSKWDANGTIVWGKYIGGLLSDLVSLVRCNSVGEIYIAGSFLDSAFFDNTNPASVLRSYGARDGFVAKYNAAGDFIFGLKSGGILNDYSRGVAFISNNEFWTSGYYNDNPLFPDPLNTSVTLANVGNNDAFFARYGQCEYPVLNQQPSSVSSCIGGTVNFTVSASGPNITYQWQEGSGINWTTLTDGGIYSGTNTATLTISGVNNTLNSKFYRCIISADCGLSINTGVGILYVTTPNVNVTATSGSLTANQQFANYQWLDCNNGSSVIPGAVSQTFLPSTNGYYAVEITLSGCPSDTSICYQITTAGLTTLNGSEIKIYPVPSKDLLTIEMSKPGNYAVQLLNLTGQNLRGESKLFTSELTLDVSDLHPGLYIAAIKSDNGQTAFKRFVKE